MVRAIALRSVLQNEPALCTPKRNAVHKRTTQVLTNGYPPVLRVERRYAPWVLPVLPALLLADRVACVRGGTCRTGRDSEEALLHVLKLDVIGGARRVAAREGPTVSELMTTTHVAHGRHTRHTQVRIHEAPHDAT